MQCYEPIFLYLLAKNNNVTQQSEVQKLKQVITTGERRIQVIDKAIEGLFEANISGKITDERFTEMTANYEKEQREPLELVVDGKKNLSDAEQTMVDLMLLMKALRDYTDIRQLTPEIVNALIRRIEVRSKDKETKKVKVDILQSRWAILCSYGKRDAGGNGGDSPNPTAVQIFCIKQNTVQLLFRDRTVSRIKLRYPPGSSSALDLFSRSLSDIMSL